MITSMHQARKTGPQPLIDLAYRRRGLVMAVIAPAILLFRFPWLAIGALRVMRSVGVWVLAILLRDPMLSSWLLVCTYRHCSKHKEKNTKTITAWYAQGSIYHMTLALDLHLQASSPSNHL